MEDKIKRYLELSKEFTVKSHEVYDGFSENSGYVTMVSGNSYHILDCRSEEVKQPTKAEQFETAQLEKIAKVKRYEEYLKLQSDLLGYYTEKEKLNGE